MDMDTDRLDTKPRRADVPSQSELLAFGANDLAYVKRVDDEGRSVHAIFRADGTQIGAAPSRETAFAAIRQHDMEPLSVH
jgi:hypothetical protein